MVTLRRATFQTLAVMWALMCSAPLSASSLVICPVPFTDSSGLIQCIPTGNTSQIDTTDPFQVESFLLGDTAPGQYVVACATNFSFASYPDLVCPSNDYVSMTGPEIASGAYYPGHNFFSYCNVWFEDVGVDDNIYCSSGPSGEKEASDLCLNAGATWTGSSCTIESSSSSSSSSSGGGDYTGPTKEELAALMGQQNQRQAEFFIALWAWTLGIGTGLFIAYTIIKFFESVIAGRSTLD